MRRNGRTLVVGSLVVLCLITTSRTCRAQIPVTLDFDGAFFADNTEFRGPFRSGETILGSFQRVAFGISLREHTALRFGVFTTEHAGSHSPVDHALPIIAVQFGDERSRFILGTLDTRDRREGFGPDITTPHNLLPALAVETDWFRRAYEAGLQWLTMTPRYHHDVWFDYQVANNEWHREKFDTGLVGRVKIAGPLHAGYQAHVVHHGGQQYWSGPVSDSLGLGPGVILDGRLSRHASAALEIYGLASYDRRDRATPRLSVKGKAAFLRASVCADRWRAHLIVWRGDNFDHEDGDPNYQSRFPDGRLYRLTRDYSEAGVSRRFRPAAGLDLESSFRLHRIEGNYAYSYRLLATAHLRLWKGAINAPQ